MFRNPAVDFDQALFVDMPFPQGSEWPHETRHRLGCMAVPGARLLVLDGLKPDGRLRQLMPQAPLHGSIWRPDLSFDAQQVLMFRGNQSVWPDLMKDARGMPGSRRVMFTGSAHHHWFAGSVGIVDPDQGFNFPWV